jgi:hypothetical protein
LAFAYNYDFFGSKKIDLSPTAAPAPASAPEPAPTSTPASIPASASEPTPASNSREDLLAAVLIVGRKIIITTVVLSIIITTVVLSAVEQGIVEYPPMSRVVTILDVERFVKEAALRPPVNKIPPL